jgi:hypothetical protein
LQCLDGFLEGEALRPQHAGCGTASIADDRSEDDRPVDLAATALPGGSGSIIEDANEIVSRRRLG